MQRSTTVAGRIGRAVLIACVTVALFSLGAWLGTWAEYATGWGVGLGDGVFLLFAIAAVAQLVFFATEPRRDS